jgi:hypothetical protein
LLAAAWSSKSKVRQNFLRSARPSARLILAPNGAWTMSCILPIWSKNPLEHDVVVGGQHSAQPGPPSPQIVDDQGGGNDIDIRHLPHEGDGGLPPTGVEPFRHRAPQPGHLLGQLVGATRGLA